MNQPRVCAAEAASVVIKPAEFVAEVDVQPLTTGLFGMRDGLAHQLTPYALVLVTPASLSVDEECVIASVPGNIDEADEEAVSITSAHPAQAVLTDSWPPPDARLAAMRGHEVDHLLISDEVSPGEVDEVRHVSSLTEADQVRHVILILR